MGDSFKTVGCVLAALVLVACTNSEFDPNAFYGDLSEAQQENYMSALVAQFNANETKSESSYPVVVTGDAKRGIITSTATYKKVVTDEQLEKAKAAVAKAKAKEPACFQPEIMSLTRYGIGFQAVMVDPAGTVLYESELCEGAPFAARPYTEQTEAQQAYTLAYLTKLYEFEYGKVGPSVKSVAKVSFTGDPITDTLRGEIAFTKRLSAADENGIKAEFYSANSHKDVCTTEGISSLTKFGVSLEIQFLDYKGKNIIPPLECQGTSTVSLSPAPKLRGKTASR